MAWINPYNWPTINLEIGQGNLTYPLPTFSWNLAYYPGTPEIYYAGPEN